jgi:excisionase family DNA binding protein
MPRSLRVSEAAEYLSCCRRTVYELLESGRLPGFRIGRAWRIRQEDLQQFAGCNQSAGQPAA